MTKAAWEMTRVEATAEGPSNQWTIPIDAELAEGLNAASAGLRSKGVIVPDRLYSEGEILRYYGYPGMIMHREIIRRALAAGKPVPAAVLADYPEVVHD